MLMSYYRLLTRKNASLRPPTGQLHALLTADGSAWVAQRRVYTSSLELRAADGRTLFVLGMFL
jgi:hypothetical protein